MNASRIRAQVPVAAFTVFAALAGPALAHTPAGPANAEPSTSQSSIYRRDTGIDDSGDYRQEVQACMSGQTSQARETCLREARNAQAEKRRGDLGTGEENYLSNAMARCQPLTGEYRAACQARVAGFGATSGSVAGGGLLREVEVVVMPADAERVRISPQTSNPVVLLPSTSVN